MLRKHATRETIFLIVLSGTLISLMVLLQADIGFNPADEGYIWYGVKAIIDRGEMPRVHYSAYDPGRYYWSALWAPILGDGPYGFRLSVYIFQFIGLSFALLVLKSITTNRWLWIIWALLITLWIFPQHKLVEISVSMISVYLAMRLVQQPTNRKFFLAGIYTGLAIFLGINLGGYTFAGFVLITLFIHFKMQTLPLWVTIRSFVSGLVLGSLPQLILYLIDPGYINSFVYHYDAVFTSGSNIGLEIPFLWRMNFTGLDQRANIKDLAMSVGFTALPIYYGLGLLALILARKGGGIVHNPVFVASVCMGVFYIHHAYSRAGDAHLAQSIHPLLIGMFSLSAFGQNLRRKLVLANTLLIVTLVSLAGILQRQPAFDRYIDPDNYARYSLYDHEFWLHTRHVRYLEVIEPFAKDNIAPEDAVLILPNNPMLYVLLDKPSPVWELYVLYRTSDSVEDQMVKDIESRNVKWFIFNTNLTDNNPNLRISVIYPKVWEYLQTKFEIVQIPGLPRQYRIYQRIE